MAQARGLAQLGGVRGHLLRGELAERPVAAIDEHPSPRGALLGRWLHLDDYAPGTRPAIAIIPSVIARRWSATERLLTPR
jgi:hypothetical protein